MRVQAPGVNPSVHIVRKQHNLPEVGFFSNSPTTRTLALVLMSPNPLRPSRNWVTSHNVDGDRLWNQNPAKPLICIWKVPS